MEAPEFNTDCESSLESRGEMFGGDKCDPRMKESPKIQFWPCDCDIFGFGSHPRVAETEGALIILGIFISSIWISFGGS
jgi:hypothetical protein